MKLTKVAIFFALLTGICSIGLAQNTKYIGKNDPDAKKVLDGLSAKLKTYKAVQANFALKVEDSKGQLQGSRNGTIYLKGNKYHVSVVGGQEIYCDGKDVYTYDKSSNEVTITKNDPTTQTISPDKLFSDFYDKDFLYKLNGEAKVGGRTVEEVELTPVDKSKNFFKALLYIDKLNHTLVSIKWFDKGGNRYTIDTSRINGSATFTDEQLAYNKAKFPGAEEVDLRN
jgi:outer membrane lipoprotein-sorting protein